MIVEATEHLPAKRRGAATAIMPIQLSNAAARRGVRNCGKDALSRSIAEWLRGWEAWEPPEATQTDFNVIGGRVRRRGYRVSASEPLLAERLVWATTSGERAADFLIRAWLALVKVESGRCECRATNGRPAHYHGLCDRARSRPRDDGLTSR